MYDVITIGAATRDIYLQTAAFKFLKSKRFIGGIGECLALGSKNLVSDIFMDTGGGATNCAATFANLGLRVAACARVGDDEAGQEIINVLKKFKVNVRFLQIDNKVPTSYSTLLLAGPGERTVLVYRGASNYLDLRPILSSKAKIKTKWFYITSLGGNVGQLKKLVDFASKKGIKVAVNPGGGELKVGFSKLGPIFKKVDVLNLNREEAAELAGEPYDNKDAILKKMARLGPRIVVVTDGPSGAYAWREGVWYFAKSLGTKPVNTTGAGDAFGSGFVAGLILEDCLDYALRLAILNSDGVIRKMGAKNGLLEKLPSLKQLKKVKIVEKRI